MAKKGGNNYNKKLSNSLSWLMKEDVDLWKKRPNENAFNSNLYRKLNIPKDHKIDMEYDDYEITALSAQLASPEIRKYINEKTKNGNNPYSPKPDIIAHSSNHRSSNTIFCVIECKFNDNLNGIYEDFLKLSSYMLLYRDIKYLNIVIYPQKGEENLSYKSLGKKSKVWNKAKIAEALNELEKNQGTILQATPYLGTLTKIFSDADINTKYYKTEDEILYVKTNDEIFKVKLNKETKKIESEIETLNKEEKDKLSSNKEISKKFEYAFKEIKNSPIRKLLESNELVEFLSLFGEAKNRKLTESFYARSGIEIKPIPKQLNADQNDNFKPYDFWRNTVVILQEKNVFKLLLQNVNKETKFKNLEKTKANYSESEKTKWHAYKQIENEENFESFIKTINLNKEEIKELVIKTLHKMIEDNSLEENWEEEQKNKAIVLLKKLSSEVVKTQS